MAYIYNYVLTNSSVKSLLISFCFLFYQLSIYSQEKSNGSSFLYPTFSINYYAIPHHFYLVNKIIINDHPVNQVGSPEPILVKGSTTKIISKGDISLFNGLGASLYVPSQKGRWVFRIDISYMPTQTKNYTKYKSDGTWSDYDSIFSAKFDTYGFSISNIYRINPQNTKIHFNLGIGLSFGMMNVYSNHFRYNSEKYNHKYAIAHPIAGITVKINNTISVFAEYHYKLGISTAYTIPITYGDSRFYYYLMGSEVMFGINFHLKSKKH